MGDIKGQARGANPPARPDDLDPFVDLAEMFETEIGRAVLAAGPVRVPEFETEFAEALAVDMARPSGGSAASSYQGWVAPRAVRLADPMEDATLYGIGSRSALALQSDLEAALKGLSSPANPRHSIIVETQSFAPERVVDDPVEDMATPELDDFDELIQSELAMMTHRDDARPALRESRTGHPASRALPAGVDYSVRIEDGDTSESYAADDEPETDAPPRRRRFLSRSMVMLGGSVAALGLVGIVGFSLLGHGGAVGLVSSYGEPPLIKADATPFKSVPTDPGGRSIPNQNKAVYERVASPAVQTAPKQQALLRESEEPIDLPEDAASDSYDNNLPGVELVDNEGLGLKGEDRVEVAAADAPEAAPVPVLQPRKVRTMVVRPDGTIVESQEPVTAAAPLAMAGAAPKIADQPALIEIASKARRDATPASALADDPAPTTPAAAAAAAMAPKPVDMGSMVPVQIADPVEVAAIAPAPVAPVLQAAPVEAPASRVEAAVPAAALPAGSYFVQISSQPSEALAQSSLQNLGSKFSSVIEGRSVGIQPAEIPGKGTFYRVRIAAASKSEASSLCNRLKAAGGNCFVAR